MPTHHFFDKLMYYCFLVLLGDENNDKIIMCNFVGS